MLLGNGDGTFQTQQTYATGFNPQSVTVADFNGDGRPDLAVTNSNTNANTVSVLLGNGDGTFQTQQIYATGIYPNSVTVGDFNGDGKLDLAVANRNDNTVSVLLGYGNGTFQTQTTYPTGFGPNSVAAADFNDDGKLDLAVANYSDNTVSVLLGYGNGTFQTQTTYPTGLFPRSVTVGDFNGDGKPDLVVANYFDGTVSVLMGNGDGTFQTQKTYPTSSAPESVTVGDFNGDGKPDLTVADTNINNNAMSVLLNTGVETTTATATEISILPVGSGDHAVEASYGGDTYYGASTSSTINLAVSGYATTMSVSSSNNPSNYDNPVTLTATLSPYFGSGHSTDGEIVTFYNGSTSIGTGMLSSGVATLNITSLPVGTNTLKARFDGDSYFTSASSALMQIVNKVSPTINWAIPVAITYGMELSATQLDASASVPGSFA